MHSRTNTMHTPTAHRLAALLLSASSAAMAQFTGPSSSRSSYLEPTAPHWHSTALISVGDSVGGYSMVGIPDGLGAYDNGNGTISILMNHELGATSGITRAHGSAGAFVSQWTLDKNSLSMLSGKDMIQSASDVFTWSGGTWNAGTTAFARLCSADLPALSAFYNANTGNGFNGRIFMNGEETGNEGRAFGFVVGQGSNASQAYELPRLGRFSWENSVANPFSGDTTVVIGTDDSSPGQVYVYVGAKQATGNAVEQAGLNNGTLRGIQVAGTPLETAASHNTTGAVGAFTTAVINTNQSGALQQTDSVAAGVTQFARPEDGAWLDGDTFVFVTTGSTSGGSAKLYRIDFTDSAFTTGNISLILDSKDLTGLDGEVARSFDNLAVGEDGLIYIQEDPGGSNYIAKTWAVDVANPTAAVQIFESDRDRFLSPTPAPYNVDEEHSGIIDVTSLFTDASWYTAGTQVFLADTQAHYNITGELVQGGQLSLLTFGAAPIPEPATYAGLAGVLAWVAAGIRRRMKRG